MTITQHAPAYVSDFNPSSRAFNSLDELLAIEWVARFKRDKDFYKFSVSKSEKQTHLMAEYNEGRNWWVVGKINGVADIEGLTDWAPNRQ